MHRISAIASVLAVVGGAPATAAPIRVAVRELPDHQTEAAIEIAVPPATVYATMTDYATWPRFLTDVTSLKVLDGGREDATVRVGSRAFGHTSTIRFRNTPPTAIRYQLVKGPPGARSHGEITLEPLANGTHTRVRAVLYLDVVGITGLFVSDARLRSIRQFKLSRDLEDLARALEAPS